MSRLVSSVLAIATLAIVGAVGFAAKQTLSSSTPTRSPSSRPGTAPAPRLATEEPLQTPPASKRPFLHGKYTITPLADYTLTARVMSREDYHFDSSAGLSPTDLALGWGRMSDERIYGSLGIRQSGRFYRYGWGADGPPIPKDEIVRSSANVHIIPADKPIARIIDGIEDGDLVHLSGQLIEATRLDGWRWRSSLVRTDSGDGACEVFWVTHAAILRDE